MIDFGVAMAQKSGGIVRVGDVEAKDGGDKERSRWNH